MSTEELRKEWFKALVALIGVMVTLILGVGQYQLTKTVDVSSNTRAVDAIEVQMIQVVSPQLVALAKECPPASDALLVVSTAGQYLTDTHERIGLSNMASQLIERCGSEVSTSPDPKRSVAELRLQEARVPATPEAAWYTVIASLPGNDVTPAVEEAKRLSVKAKSLGFSEELSLYKTKISNNYAVVVGGEQSKTEAISLAGRARSTGFIPDAFAQRDREWQFIRVISE